MKFTLAVPEHGSSSAVGISALTLYSVNVTAFSKPVVSVLMSTWTL